jgi:hypothetical protein
LGLESGRLGFGSGARGGHPGRQRCREGAAAMGGRRGSPPAPRPHGVRHGIRQGRGKGEGERRADRRVPRGSETRSGEW